MKAKSHERTMSPNTKAHPGLELDSKGEPIAMKDRLPEDREKVHRASRRKAAKSKSA